MKEMKLGNPHMVNTLREKYKVREKGYNVVIVRPGCTIQLAFFWDVSSLFQHINLVTLRAFLVSNLS